MFIIHFERSPRIQEEVDVIGLAEDLQDMQNRVFRTVTALRELIVLHQNGTSTDVEPLVVSLSNLLNSITEDPPGPVSLTNTLLSGGLDTPS